MEGRVLWKPVWFASLLCLAACEPSTSWFVTAEGVRWSTVGCEDVEVPAPDVVQGFVSVAAGCWGEYPKEQVLGSFAGARVVLLCVSASDLGAAALTWPDARLVNISAWGPNPGVVDPARLSGLVAHELGHLVFGDATGVWDPVDTAEEHHVLYGPVEEAERCAVHALRIANRERGTT